MNSTFSTIIRRCLITAGISVIGLAVSFFGHRHASAQQPINHELIRGDLPPGMASQFYQMSDRSLVGHVQPVQIVAENCVLEVGDAGGSFSNPQPTKISVAMDVGFAYRFKLSNLPVPNANGRELYPSIEVLGRLNPPQGLETDFPIQVVVTRDDIQHALDGRLVTRVIYLEDPRGPLPHLHNADEQPSFDVLRGQDPLRAAQQLGRPMAILRMGSRVPAKNDHPYSFNFGVSVPQVLANPSLVSKLDDSETELQVDSQVRPPEHADETANSDQTPKSGFATSAAAFVIRKPSEIEAELWMAAPKDQVDSPQQKITPQPNAAPETRAVPAPAPDLATNSSEVENVAPSKPIVDAASLLSSIRRPNQL